MGLKELLKSLELPQDITRRGFLKATSMAAVLTMVNEARAKIETMMACVPTLCLRQPKVF